MTTFNVTNSDDSGIGSLREAVELANVNPGSDDIFVQTDVQLNSAIKITESVNIGTPYGATISQTETSRIFEIDDGNLEQKSDVSLYRLNLTGANGDLGGAIISYENLNITDSSLYDNSAETNGAAVYVMGADLIVERSRIYDNQITSLEEVEDRDLYVFNGKFEVINSTLDATEESIEDNSAKEESLVEENSNEASSNNLVDGETDDTLSSDAGNDIIWGDDVENSLEEMASNGNFWEKSDRDFVNGSDEDDTLDGSDGDDNLSGNDGNDGNDIINGNAGVDVLDGGAGDDRLNGGAERDLVRDSSGNNIIFGNESGDRLIGGIDLDYLHGGTGDDYLNGGEGDDTLTGEMGDDTLDGAAGNDTLLGSDGNDLIYGAGGNDILHGHDGDDYLLGSTEDDILHGDGGNDTLSGDEGDNLLTGGDGNDLFNLIFEGNSVVADFELGTDKLQLSQIAYSDLSITGEVNSIINYQDTQIALVMEVNPAELTQDNFVEV